MTDKCTIWLSDADSTHSAGVSLASTLYRTNITIGFIGELGSGKTTFLQGFLKGLGVLDTVTSPTYALEQRYKVESGKWKMENDAYEILHIDLYRLTEKQSNELLQQSDDHTGIRCIEWVDRSSMTPDILIKLEEKDEGRNLTVSFDDMNLPTESDIVEWRKEVALPHRICDHCDAVSRLSADLGEEMMNRGIIIRPQALKVSALVHDLLRFIDFSPGGGHGPDEKSEAPEWKLWKKKYKGKEHEEACATLLQERGYPELATIVEVHGLILPSPDRVTIEQKLLFYADKRVKMDEIVTLEERFDDFRKRYSGGKNTKKGDIWFAEAKAVEKELGF